MEVFLPIVSPKRPQRIEPGICPIKKEAVRIPTSDPTLSSNIYRLGSKTIHNIRIVHSNQERHIGEDHS